MQRIRHAPKSAPSRTRVHGKARRRAVPGGALARPGKSEPLAQQVWRQLADGQTHSGEQLAQEFAVSRSAVWKAVSRLRALGTPIKALRHRGYQQSGAAAPLALAAINTQLTGEARAALRSGAVRWSVPSTNDELLAQRSPPAGQFDFLLAEHQQAGRGRQARRWLSPPGGGLCLSLAWTFKALPRDAGALSLAVGVCVLRALHRFAPLAVNLKWPNDLVSAGGKLGGILIDLRAEAAGPAVVVIGVGLNCALGAPLSTKVRATGTEPVDLAGLGVGHCDRNRLAALLISDIVAGLLQFERDGFAPFAALWRAADALAGRAVTVSGPQGQIVGHARGIDEDGALCVQTRDALLRFRSGDVSVRPGH
jgi:BirA family transcriptional regulator, biotin operon repressor / biotin---[acetyl-CoA-carboxylase] ligase